MAQMLSCRTVLTRRFWSVAKRRNNDMHNKPSRRWLSALLRLDPGVYPILVTPFHDNEAIDLVSFQRTIEFFSKCDIAGMTICGVLGEGDKLLDSERAQMISAARETLDKTKDSTTHDDSSPLHLCVGASHASTAGTVALCQMAHDFGADSVMVAPTVAHARTRGILDLYQRIGDTCPRLGIVVQDYPAYSSVHLSIDTLVELSNLSTVISIKLESLPTYDRLQALTTSPQWEDGATVLTGLGAVYAGFDLNHNEWSGFMTGFSVPEVLTSIFDLVKIAEPEAAYEVYQRFLPLLVLEQYGGLPLRKEMARRRGWIANPRLRQPSADLSWDSIVMLDTLSNTLESLFPPTVDWTKPLPDNIIANV